MTEFPPGATAETHWVIDASGIEWLYTLNEMALRLDLMTKDKVSGDVIYANTNGPSTMFFLKKTAVPISELMKTTGISLLELEKNNVIKLRMKPMPDLPEPTVSGWGKA